MLDCVKTMRKVQAIWSHGEETKKKSGQKNQCRGGQRTDTVSYGKRGL